MKLLSLNILAVASLLATVSNSEAVYVNKAAGNTTQATAQNLDSFFDLAYDVDIDDASNTNTSTSIPHATVTGPNGLAVGNAGEFDWYSFTATAGQTIILDIDYGMFDFDANLALYFGASLIAGNDDSNSGSAGSAHPYDSFIQLVAPSTGLYEVGVGRCCFMSPLPGGSDYRLHVSVGGHSTSVPDGGATASLLGISMLGLGALRRFKRA